MHQEKPMLKNRLIVLDKEKAGEAARRNFMEMCGFGGAKAVPAKRVERALSCLELVAGRIELRALISEYPGCCAAGTGLFIDGETFNCPALSQLSGEVEKIYVYLLTAGKPVYQADTALDEVYGDLWLNAYMDAALDMLRLFVRRLEDSGSRHVSRPVGPGLYGMDASALRQIFNLLDGGRIGVELVDESFMSPMKSFAGFFLVTDRPWDFADEDCKSCPGGAQSCRYCKLGYSRSDD
jgi:hypothetical protein